MKNKVVCRVTGGLGNQLFGYSAARRLALVNNAELVIDDVSGFTYDHVYQRSYQLDHFQIPGRKATPRERLEPFPRIRRYIKKRFNSFKNFDKRSYITQEKVDFDDRLLDLRIRGTLYIEGYWQSEQYFQDIEDIIRNDLVITPPTSETNLAMADRIRSTKSVAIHYRYFNEDQKSPDNLSWQYYERAIAHIKKIYPDGCFYVFSDKPEIARENIAIDPSRLVLVNHNKGDEKAYADMWLMSQCRHFIIANSTFSWWAAWLADYQDKVIIAPALVKRTGVSWWGFEGLLPSSWVQL